MGTKVSVILPVYNVSDYLRQCMDSIVGQTLKDIEIICVDDGSTDDSLAILKEYEAKDQRVKVIQQANAGAGAARNKGLEIATGEYLSAGHAGKGMEQGSRDQSSGSCVQIRSVQRGSSGICSGQMDTSREGASTVQTNVFS